MSEHKIPCLLNFDQSFLRSLIKLSQEEREALFEKLAAETDDARVRVVSRRFMYNFDFEDQDYEYEGSAPVPEEWKATVAERFERHKNGMAVGLEFDEGPEEHRARETFGYVQTKLQLSVDVQVGRLGLTGVGVVEIPGFGEEGRVWYFDD